MTLDYKNTLAVALLIAVIGVFSIIWQSPNISLGNVRVGDQLQSTTTPQVADLRNLCPARNGVSPVTGMLGSVHILGSGTGQLAFIDATTSDITLRTGNVSTTSLILAWYPNITATSSVPFNVEFKNGLLVDYTGTVVGTSTITYRCEG